MRWRGDSGATLVTTAMVLFLLMGVAALALDLSAGWNERRQDQTGADLSVMAGALSFVFTDMDPVVEEAMATARLNIDSEYSDGEWVVLWQACVDDYPGFVGITHSALGYIDCVGVNSAAGLMRVRLPDQLVDTTFGQILGVDWLNTHAGAVVILFEVGGSGALPFAVRGDATPGLLCLNTGPSGTAQDPCTGPERGSFGNIVPPLFGNLDMSTSPDCSGQVSGENVAAAIAMGLDHQLYALEAIPGDRNDSPRNREVDSYTNMDECIHEGGDFATPADGDPINGVYVDTGNNVKSDITLGLVTGNRFPDGGPARLRRTDPDCDPTNVANPCRRVRTVDTIDLDNTPLWFHLFAYDSGPLNSTVCDRDTYYDGVAAPTTEDRNTRMSDCLIAWSDGTLPGPPSPQIFANTILTNNPRLGFAPHLWHNNFGSGLAFRAIETFSLVYVSGLWFDDRGSTEFHPDDQAYDPIVMGNWRDVEQVTAFLLDDEMVSEYVLLTVGKLRSVIFEPTLFE